MKPAKVLTAVALLLVTSTAQAQSGEGGAAPGDATELEALRGELDAGLELAADQLASGDCAAACEALASMERSAERICELDPGPPCDAAQRDVEGARERVRAACPECAVRGDGEEVRAAEPVTREEEGAPMPASAPPSEDVRGGCAACEVGPVNGPSDDAGWVLLAGAALFAARRRRRR